MSQVRLLVFYCDCGFWIEFVGLDGYSFDGPDKATFCFTHLIDFLSMKYIFLNLCAGHIEGTYNLQVKKYLNFNFFSFRVPAN